MKIRPVGVEFLCGRKEGRKDRRLNGQTWTHDKANSCFSQFCESALKKSIFATVRTAGHASTYYLLMK